MYVCMYVVGWFDSFTAVSQKARFATAPITANAFVSKSMVHDDANTDRQLLYFIRGFVCVDRHWKMNPNKQVWTLAMVSCDSCSTWMVSSTTTGALVRAAGHAHPSHEAKLAAWASRGPSPRNPMGRVCTLSDKR